MDWSGPGPISARFQDVYFNREDGPGESQHVFLNGNSLAERFSELRPNDFFQIGELGFGTGLNFLCAVDLFQARAPASARLNFVSCERYPLTRDQLKRAQREMAVPRQGAADLIRHYPSLMPGMHRIDFGKGRISLTLFFGDVLDFLQELIPGRGIDAWFLDGFAPSKNQAMWSSAVFSGVAGCSRRGATAATFSVAGAVRRGLAAEGFEVVRLPGFGRKKEMIRAILRSEAGIGTLDLLAARQHVIWGAGLAGSAMAGALRRRGLSFELRERSAVERADLHGNPALLTHPQFFAGAASGYGFTLQGLGYLRSLLLERIEKVDGSIGQGSLRLLQTPAERQRMERAIASGGLPPDLVRIVGAEESSDLAGVFLESAALYIPGALVVDPTAILESDCGVAGEPRPDTEELHIIAAGFRSNELLNSFGVSPLPLNALCGQVTSIGRESFRHLPRMAVCYDGYALPTPEALVLGSTYERVSPVPSPREHVNRDLIEKFLARVPGAQNCFARDSSEVSARGWTGARATTPDRLPFVGRLQESVAVLTGFGSRGLITTNLCAELLTCELVGELAPMARSTRTKLRPDRFALA